MIDSILTSVKKNLGIVEAQTAFDDVILLHINSAFSILTQLGIGPSTGVFVEDASATWGEFLEDDRMNSVRTYVTLRVRLWFDPPTLSFVIESMNNQIQELEWRLNVTREEDQWVDPTLVET